MCYFSLIIETFFVTDSETMEIHVSNKKYTTAKKKEINKRHYTKVSI